MKTLNPVSKKWLTLPILALAFSVVTSGCSTFGGGGGKTAASGQEIATSGPTIINPRTSPETFELNQNYQPTQNAEIFVDVKDFTAKVSDVKLRFVHAPLEIPMQLVSGTTWRAQLTPEQLKLLAVGGQTMKYEVNVVATNEDGQIGVSREPINVSVKAPDLGKKVG